MAVRGQAQPVILQRMRIGVKSHGTRGWAPGGGDVHHESDDICAVEAPHAGRAKKGSRPDGATRTAYGVEAKQDTARWTMLLREFKRKARRSSRISPGLEARGCLALLHGAASTSLSDAAVASESELSAERPEAVPWISCSPLSLLRAIPWRFPGSTRFWISTGGSILPILRAGRARTFWGALV